MSIPTGLTLEELCKFREHAEQAAMHYNQLGAETQTDRDEHRRIVTACLEVASMLSRQIRWYTEKGTTNAKV
jgi:hypothetical protein